MTNIAQECNSPYTVYLDGQRMDDIELEEFVFPTETEIDDVVYSMPNVSLTLQTRMLPGFWRWIKWATRRPMDVQRFRLLAHKRICTARRFSTG